MTKINSLAGAAAVAALTIGAANAAEISTNTALMQAMDKITGEVSVIEVPVNSEVRFGSFSILVRACKTRPPEETPENFAFVDVVDVTNGKENVNIFKGWMMSSSPALNAIEHPVYDVWLLRCINSENKPQTAPMSAEQLQQRDYIEMLRPAAEPTAGAPLNENYSSSDGEPIDLIPADIQDISGEEQAQSEVIKLDAPAEPQAADTLKPEVNTPQNAEPQSAEGAPQSLLAAENEPKAEPQTPAVTPKTSPEPQALPQPEEIAPTTPETASENSAAEAVPAVETPIEKPAAPEALVEPAPAPVPATETTAETVAEPTVDPAPAPAAGPESDDNEEIIINLENELSNGLLNE